MSKDMRMQNRSTRLFLWALTLFLGLSLAAGYATADLSADKDNKKGTAKAKTGEACKRDSDCDQSSLPQSCIDSKCRINPPPVPTT
jgi:hypothetical protein